MAIDVKSEGVSEMFRREKSFLAVVFLQLGLAGMDAPSKAAMATLVMAHFAFILDREVRPRMTRAVFVFGKLLLLGLLELEVVNIRRIPSQGYWNSNHGCRSNGHDMLKGLVLIKGRIYAKWWHIKYYHTTYQS